MKAETNKFINYIKAHKTFIVYDVETSGLSKINDVITEFSAIVYAYVEGRYTLVDEFEQYIRPLITIPDKVVALNGISNEFLEQYPYEREAYMKIKAFLSKYEDAVILGYNQTKFDDAMFYQLMLRQDEKNAYEHPKEEIDVFSMVKENIFEKDRKLQTVHSLLCPNVTNLSFHNSSDDVKATWNVAVALYNQNKGKISTMQGNPVSCRYWAPGGRNRFFFTIIKLSNGEFCEIYYDHYYKTWKSKEIDISRIDTDYVEERLNQSLSDFTKYDRENTYFFKSVFQ